MLLLAIAGNMSVSAAACRPLAGISRLMLLEVVSLEVVVLVAGLCLATCLWPTLLVDGLVAGFRLAISARPL